MDSESSVFRGRIEKRTIYSESRSERLGYVLALDEDTFLPLEVQGRDPFHQVEFSPFDGHSVVVHGRQAGDTIIASKVIAVDADLVWQLDYKKRRVCLFCASPLSDDVTAFCPVCGAKLDS
jgi:hypothetical protein